MNGFNKKRLQNLLSNYKTSNPTIQKCCLACITNGLNKYICNDKVALTETIDIYNRRWLLSLEQKNIIEGFEHLMSSLTETKAPFIKIHSLETNDETFIVFTDISTSRIISVLRIEKYK